MTTNQNHSEVVTIDLLTDLIARTEYLALHAERLARRRVSRQTHRADDASERSISMFLLELHGLHAQLGAAIAAMERRELRKLF